MAQLHPRFQRTVALESERRLDGLIESFVEPGNRVIDLGCGSGDLLHRLIQNKQVQARGVEISSEGIKACIEKGLSVYQGDLDDGLEDFDKGVFDIVILNLTLSMLHNPDLILSEVVRIGKKAIISFYNAGYLPLREQFMQTGEMAAVHPEGAEWYKSPQIHPFSVLDFEKLCQARGINCVGRAFVDSSFKHLEHINSDTAQAQAFAAVYLIEHR